MTIKKRNLGRMVALAAVLCLITTCLLGGTLAKYTSTATGTDSATVAKWSFDVGNGNDIATSNTFTFDLFGDKVAPGGTGNIDINLENKSDVDAKYTIGLTETNLGSVPIEYSKDGITWVDDITTLGITDVEISASDGNPSGADEGTASIYWRWVTESDSADTAFGVKGTLDTVTVAATVTATQDATNITNP